MNTNMIDEMFEILREAMNKQYADRLPQGFYIYKLAEYTQDRFPAPNLWFEKKQNPAAKYLCIISDDCTASVPALGETVNAAIAAAIAKHESWGATKQ
jgi:hypothetical protein